MYVCICICICICIYIHTLQHIWRLRALKHVCMYTYLFIYTWIMCVRQNSMCVCMSFVHHSTTYGGMKLRCIMWGLYPHMHLCIHNKPVFLSVSPYALSICFSWPCLFILRLHVSVHHSERSVHMYVCMYACMYVDTYVYMYICFCTDICIQRVLLFLSVSLFIDTHYLMCIHISICLCIYVCMYTYTYTHYWDRTEQEMQAHTLNILSHTYIHVCIHVRMYVCMYSCMHDCSLSSLYVCMYICMHVCV